MAADTDEISEEIIDIEKSDSKSIHHRARSDRAMPKGGKQLCYICRERTANTTTLCGCEVYDNYCIEEWVRDMHNCPRCKSAVTLDDLRKTDDGSDADNSDSDYTIDSEGFHVERPMASTSTK